MKYGFIGCGNMGGAVARAVCKGAGAGDVLLANRTPAKAQALAGELGCACGTNEQVASICDFIFLGVKPQMMADMLDELAPALARGRFDWVLVTSADGLSTPAVYRELDRLRALPDIAPDVFAACSCSLAASSSRAVVTVSRESSRYGRRSTSLPFSSWPAS